MGINSSHNRVLQGLTFFFFPVCFYAPVALPLYMVLFSLFFVGNPQHVHMILPKLKNLVGRERKKFLLITPLFLFALLPVGSPLGTQIRFSAELVGILIILLLLIVAKDVWQRKDTIVAARLDIYLGWGLVAALSLTLVDFMTGYKVLGLMTTRHPSGIKFHKGLVFAILYGLLKTPYHKSWRSVGIWLLGLTFLYVLTRLYDSDALSLGLIVGTVASFAASFIPWALLAFGVCFVGYLLCMPWLIHYLITPSFFAQYMPHISYTWEHRLYSWQYFLTRIYERMLLGWGPGASKHPSFRKVVSWHISQYVNAQGHRVMEPTVNHLGVYQKETLLWSHEVSEYPHNFALQVWLEFGLVGVMCVSMLMVYVLSHMYKLRQEESARFIGVMVCLCAILSAGFNMWQKWLLAGLSVLFVFYDIRVKALKE